MCSPAATGRLDLLADFAEPLPAIVTAEMLGVPVEDHQKLKNWSVTFAEMLGNFQHNPDRLPGVLDAVEKPHRLFPGARSASNAWSRARAGSYAA